jgi:hypothetical protein
MRKITVKRSLPILLAMILMPSGFSYAQTTESSQANSSSNVISKKSDIRLFENLAIAPKFKPDPQVLRGISGGTEETQKYSGKAQTETGACIGFVDAAPDHKITLTGEFKHLSLKVMSSGDTVLLIRGPGGSWCSDDVSDRNPEIGGAWLPGTYEIWVGSYEANTSFPYLLQLSETREPDPKPQASSVK